MKKEEHESEKNSHRKGSLSRIHGVDVARGIALLGMMAVHIMPDVENGDVSLWWILFAGRSAALFAVLAGVSITFMSGGTRVQRGGLLRATQSALVCRAVLIAALGLALGDLVGLLTDHQSDEPVHIILAAYGFIFLLCTLVLACGPRALIAWCAFFVMCGPVAMQFMRPFLPSVTMPNPTFSSLLSAPTDTLWNVLFTGAYPAVVWIAYLLAGMAVGRLLSVDTPRCAARLMAFGVALAVSASFVSGQLLELVGGVSGLATMTPSLSLDEVDDAVTMGADAGLPVDSWWWLVTQAPHSSTPFDVMHTLGSALAVLGLCLLLTRRWSPGLTPLAALGKMPLTLYVIHVPLVELWNPERVQPWLSLALQVALLVGFAMLWTTRFQHGPLEWVIAHCARLARALCRGIIVLQTPPRLVVPLGGNPSHSFHTPPSGLATQASAQQSCVTQAGLPQHSVDGPLSGAAARSAVPDARFVGSVGA